MVSRIGHRTIARTVASSDAGFWPEPEHGTVARYNKRCRCFRCMDAIREYRYKRLHPDAIAAPRKAITKQYRERVQESPADELAMLIEEQRRDMASENFIYQRHLSLDVVVSAGGYSLIERLMYSRSAGTAYGWDFE